MIPAIEDQIFWLMALVTLVPGIAVLFVKDIVRLAFWFLATLAGVAGLYMMLAADFLAFIQVLVYIGGILILLLFGVMLTHRDPIFFKRSRKDLIAPGIISGAAVLFALLGVITRTGWFSVPATSTEPTTADIGVKLMSDYVLPFEVASLVLLVALVGAAYIGRRQEAK